MALPRILAIVNGLKAMLVPVSTSTGAAMASSVVATNANGYVDPTLLPVPTTSTLGGVQAVTAVAHKWVSAISVAGVPALTQPSTSDISGLGTIATQAASGVAITGGTVSGLTSLSSKVTSSPPVTVTYAATLSINLATGTDQMLTLTGNTTITLTGAVAGTTYMLEATQDATGGRLASWTNTIRWQNGTAPILSTAGGKTDLIGIRYNGTSYFGWAVLNF